MLLLIAYLIGGSFWACGMFMLYRNHYVYRYRMKILDDPSVNIGECFRKLPSYHQMMWQIFTFNWDHYWKEPKG